MIELGLYDRLSNWQPIAAIVGRKVFPEVAPQGEVPPYIVFQLVDDIGEDTLTEAAGFSVARIQVDSYGKGPQGYRDAVRLDEEVRKCLDGYMGYLGTIQTGGIKAGERRSLPTPPGQASDTTTRRISRDAVVWYHQSVPTFN